MRTSKGEPHPSGMLPARQRELRGRIEPFDSFWEAPDDVESGYDSFARYYRHNYLKYLPKDRSARILCVSCGPGYLVKLLTDLGYENVLGIDSFAEKIANAQSRGLNCRVDYAFDALERSPDGTYDVIFCEQELNHLDRDEVGDFLVLCRRKLKSGGLIACFFLNGANPITGAEALAQNFDHFSTATEYSARQVLTHAGFERAKVFGLHLYVYWSNPFNYVAWAASSLLSALFRAAYILYGKKNRLFTKKIGAIAFAPGSTGVRRR